MKGVGAAIPSPCNCIYMSERTKHQDVSPEILQAIGYVSIVAGNIEHFLEDTILAIAKEHLIAVRPRTDLVPVAKLINRFRDQSNGFVSPALKEIARYWCEASLDAFICRNAILHGRSIVWTAESLDFITNTRYNLEIRRLTSRTFIASVDTARQLAEVFGLLAHVITGFMLFVRGTISEQEFMEAVSLDKLRDAISTAHELANLVDCYSHEKY